MLLQFNMQMKNAGIISDFKVNKARKYIFRRDNNACCKCGLKFNNNTNTKKNIDHIIPRSVFAWSHPFNLQLLCQPCNKEKGDIVLKNSFDIIERAITRTAELFLDISPDNVPKTNKERLQNITNYSWQEEFDMMNMIFSNFEETYDILSIYYFDDQINARIGISLYEEYSIGMIDGSYNIFKEKLELVSNYAFQELFNDTSRFSRRCRVRRLAKAYDSIAFGLGTIRLDGMSDHFRREYWNWQDL